ncbi:MAG: MBL fold metallo-hydrolase [Promethearchaeota archaeon]
MVSQTLYHFNNQVLEWRWSAYHEFLKEPFWITCFLIDGLLKECASPRAATDFRTFFHSLIDDNKIEKCVVTHNHEDHCGCGYILQKEFKIPIYASEKAIPLLRVEKNLPDYRQMTWGKIYIPFDANLVEKEVITKLGKYKFEIFAMPGHAEKLISLIEKDQQWAFTTDAVMPNYKMIFGKNTDIPEDISLIYKSIKDLYNYTDGIDNFQIITSGRGILKGREFLIEKMEEIKKLHQEAHKNKKLGMQKGLRDIKLIRFIMRNMFKKESFIGIFTRGDLSIKNLIISLLEWDLED